MIPKVTVLAILAVLALASTDNKNYEDRFDKPFYTGQDEEEEEFMEAVGIGYIIGMILLTILNVYLCVKCYQKRALSQNIKDQMMMRKMDFGARNGINVQTLNDARLSQTIHI